MLSRYYLVQSGHCGAASQCPLMTQSGHQDRPKCDQKCHTITNPVFAERSPAQTAELNAAMERCSREPVEAVGHLMFRCFATWRRARHVAAKPKRQE